MTRLILVVPLLGTTLVAQQPATGVTQPSVQQPIVRHTLSVAGEPLRPAADWTLTPDGALGADAVVTASGPGVRITATAAVTVFRPQWALDSVFTVGATFQASQPSAVYGVTVGGANGLAWLVRSDGAVSVQRLSDGKPSGGSWAPVALRLPSDDAPGSNRLDVRVGTTAAIFVVNGQQVSATAIKAGEFAGAPGVHVGATTDVTVAGFTVERAAAVLTPREEK
jgi:hypothetical protein